MSHYLAYVYGPKDYETLERVLKPYNENWNCPKTGGLPPELVVLENVPVMTMETTLFDMITEFRKITDKGRNYNKFRPVLLVDDAYDYLDISSIRELDAFVISYDMDSKKATAKVVVSRAFWDWWVVGGRWPIQFEAKGAIGPFMTNVIGPAEVSWAVDKAELESKQEGRFASLKFGDINWKKAKRERVKSALEMWEVIYKADPALQRAGDILKRMNIPKGAPYYTFDHEEYEAWNTKVLAIAREQLPNWTESMWAPYDLAGMSRRELIRYAIARTYIAAIGVFYEEERFEEGGVFTRTTVYDWSFFEHPTDQDVREVLKRVRKISLDTVVTAVDIHN